MRTEYSFEYGDEKIDRATFLIALLILVLSAMDKNISGILFASVLLILNAKIVKENRRS